MGNKRLGHALRVARRGPYMHRMADFTAAGAAGTIRHHYSGEAAANKPDAINSCKPDQILHNLPEKRDEPSGGAKGPTVTTPENTDDEISIAERGCAPLRCGSDAREGAGGDLQPRLLRPVLSLCQLPEQGT